MKKIFRFALLALMSLSAVACANDIDDNIAPEQEMVTVYFTAGKDATRTTLDSNLNVLWSDSDQLRIEYDKGGSNYGIADPAVITKNNGTNATFAITLPAGFEDKAVFAAYPYWAGGWGGSGINLYQVTIPATQTMVDGGFADNVNTSVCKLVWDEVSSTYSGQMVNVGGIIAVKVSGDVNITKAVLTSKDGKVMAGTGTAYNISESGCSWDGSGKVDSNPQEITLNAVSALNCAEGVELMFVACANNFSGGFTLSITSDTNKTVQYDLAGGELARARILDLAPVALDANDYAGNVINLRGTYKTKKIASQWARADATKTMGKTIMTAEDAGFQPEAAPKLGQKYGVIYEDNGWNNMVLYFDVDTELNANGMYDLINLQDRASSATGGGGYDQITHNASYYDPNTGFVYFDFIRAAYQSPGYNDVELPEGHVAGYGYSYMFYVGTMPSHAMVGNYTVTYETSQFAATPLSSVAKHIGTTIFDANTNPDAASDPVTNTAFGSPKDGQEFKLRYWWGMSIYFDLSTKTNADGTIDIVNLIDRELGYDEITHNGSYYNPATGEVLIDFVIKASSAPGVKADTAPEEPYTLPGYAVCARLTPAE